MPLLMDAHRERRAWVWGTAIATLADQEGEGGNIGQQCAITRIGGGSIGGKARGLAFVNRMLNESQVYRRHPDLRITVPRAAVVGTAASVAVETAKVPFKVAGTAIDIVTDDEDPDDADKAGTEDE